MCGLFSLFTQVWIYLVIYLFYVYLFISWLFYLFLLFYLFILFFINLFFFFYLFITGYFSVLLLFSFLFVFITSFSCVSLFYCIRWCVFNCWIFLIKVQEEKDRKGWGSKRGRGISDSGCSMWLGVQLLKFVARLASN